MENPVRGIETVIRRNGEPVSWPMVRHAERNGFADVSDFGN